MTVALPAKASFKTVDRSDLLILLLVLVDLVYLFVFSSKTAIPVGGRENYFEILNIVNCEYSKIVRIGFFLMHQSSKCR